MTVIFVLQTYSLNKSITFLTYRGIKKTLLFSRDHSTADSLAQVKLFNSAHLFSDDLKEAMQAAMTKKQATFKGE